MTAAFYIDPEIETSDAAFDQWWTPEPLATRMVEAARQLVRVPVGRPVRALEPSAGSGSILRQFPAEWEATSVELDSRCLPTLAAARKQRHSVVGGDFVYLTEAQTWPADYFDVTVMNSPYSRPREGLDLGFLIAALQVSRLVVALTRLSVLCRKGVYNAIWSRVGRDLDWDALYLFRGRPDFGGDFGAMTDYCVLALSTTPMRLSPVNELHLAPLLLDWWNP